MPIEDEDIEELLRRGKRPQQIFTDAQVDKLVYALAEGAGAEGFTDEDAERFLGWCIHATLDGALVDLLLRGEIVVKWPTEDPEPTFRKR